MVDAHPRSNDAHSKRQAWLSRRFDAGRPKRLLSKESVQEGGSHNLKQETRQMEGGRMGSVVPKCRPKKDVNG